MICLSKWLRRIMGLDYTTSDEVHRIKNEFASEMMKVHSDARKLAKETQRLGQKIRNTTAYQIAEAAGTNDNGQLR